MATKLFDNQNSQNTQSNQYNQKGSYAFHERMDNFERKKKSLQSHYKKLLSEEAHEIGLHKNTSNLFRHRETSEHTIDVRQFNQILSVDVENLTADIEGMTTYESIVDETLKWNLLPCVVPELKSITIGGALTGGGIESSSFKYGLVHETILEFEALLGDGRVVLCRPDNEHHDLFYAFPNTYGTLGYALRVKIRLTPAKKIVKLNHYRFKNPEEYFKSLTLLCSQNRQENSEIKFIDGVIFSNKKSKASPKEYYITTGEFVESAPRVSDYTYLNIFYKSIQNKKTDYLTTKDYIWRWDSDWFWCSKHFYMQNIILRFLFGKFVLKSTFFWKLRKFFSKNKTAKKLVEKFQGKRESVIQDIEVPVDKAQAFLEFFNHEIGISPIWVCPTMPYDKKLYDFYKMEPETLYINFGFWDTLPSTEKEGFYNRKIEHKVQELNGNKSLYSNVYYTNEEFWKIYDKKHYMQLKEKYDPKQKLKGLYKKAIEK